MPIENLIIDNGFVTGYHKEVAHLVIPEGVIEIEEGAFEDCLWLNSVSIESSVFRTIGDNAFKGCKNLKSVTINALRGAIGAYAFDNCKQLERLTIPSGAMEIRKCAFNSCVNLSEVAIPSSVMIIADSAFDTLLCKKLLILCSSYTEAAQFAEKNRIPYRQDTYMVRNALKIAQTARNNLETRTFNLFGQKIVAPNSLSIYVDVPNHYAQRKNTFFNSFLRHIPATASAPIDGDQVVKDMDAVIQETILRLEGYGVFTNRSHIDIEILAAYKNIATVIQTAHEFRNELWNVGSNNLEKHRERLLQEAESKVTGLSYGVIGDSLTMVTHAIDDFRARQRQRANAYSIAMQQYNAYASQTDTEINAAYNRFYNNTAKPALRTGTDALIDALCRVELRLLKEYGLLEEIAGDAYDAQKSADILKRANSMDKEFAVGLALKTYPLNLEAYTFAGKNNLATDELLDLISFMQIKDVAALNAVLHSSKVTTKKLVEHYTINRFSDVYRTAIIDRCNSVSCQIESLLDAKYQNMSAQELQQQIESIVDTEGWNAARMVQSLVSEKFLLSIKKQNYQVNTEKDYQNLGQYIADFHAGQADADKLAGRITGILDWKEKVEKAYEIKDVLGKERTTKLLSRDVSAAATKLLQGGAPEYTGTNEDAIQRWFKRKIDDQWGELTVRYLKEMDVLILTVKVTELPEKLTAMHIENEQRRLVNELEATIKNNRMSYAAALICGQSYKNRLPHAQLRSILAPYSCKALDAVNAFCKNPKVPSGAELDKSKDIAQAAMVEIMPQEAWEMYYYLEYQYKVLLSGIEKAVEEEIRYKEACAAYEKASKLRSFQEAYGLFAKVNADFKDCKDRKGACDKKIKELEKKAKSTKIIAPLSIALVLLVTAVLVFTMIIPTSKYNDAVALMEAGKYEEAISAFTALDEYKDSVAKIEDCIINIYGEEVWNKIESVNVGDTYTFGLYEQDNKSDIQENIEWLVLSKEGAKILVISKYALDCKPYNTICTNVTWETCTLRKWLNSDFINSAFSVEEQAMIPTVTVSTDKNPAQSTNPGNTTQDQVFLLSVSEVEKYFSSDSARICNPTDYAVANGVSEIHNCCGWWLRSPGARQDKAATVYDRSIIGDGHYVDSDSNAVRPAMWIDLSKLP